MLLEWDLSFNWVDNGMEEMFALLSDNICDSALGDVVAMTCRLSKLRTRTLQLRV